MKYAGYFLGGIIAVNLLVGAFSDPGSEPEDQVIQQMIEEKIIEERARPAQQPVRSSNCHPSYSGCLRPDASDYDCAGGSGNGPYYTGPVRVIGSDVFGLDRDGDGWGCEKN